jgi:hypothetical protein
VSILSEVMARGRPAAQPGELASLNTPTAQ